MPQIDKILTAAFQNRASDVHLSSGEPIRFRIDGDLVPYGETILDSETIEKIIFEILFNEEREKFIKQRNLDRCHLVQGVSNFRANIFMMRRGIAAVFRTIPMKIPNASDLGLPESVIGLTELPKGLILVTGPTGSGKSTTLAALVNHINKTYPYHILTAEDPVEFIYNSERSLINQREIGSNCPTFADALKYALREDPDVILVGEMRDLETIALAMTAAETGHLVFGTLHTRGAAATVERIVDSFPSNQQAMIRTMLSESLAAVLSQALLKRADGKGRVAAYEIMIVNHAISNLIRENKTFQIPSIIQTARKEGMILMDQHLKELVNRGVVTADEANPYLSEGAKPNHDKGGGAPAKPKEPLKPIVPIPAVKGSIPTIMKNLNSGGAGVQAAPPPSAPPAAPAAAPAAGAPPPFKAPGAPQAPPGAPPVPGTNPAAAGLKPMSFAPLKSEADTKSHLLDEDDTATDVKKRA